MRKSVGQLMIGTGGSNGTQIRELRTDEDLENGGDILSSEEARIPSTQTITNSNIMTR